MANMHTKETDRIIGFENILEHVQSLASVSDKLLALRVRIQDLPGREQKCDSVMQLTHSVSLPLDIAHLLELIGQ